VDELCVPSAIAGDGNTGKPDASGAVTMMTASSDHVIDIPDAVDEGVTDTVAFTAACDDIVDIAIDIDITHPWRGDLVVSLTSPSATEVDLHDYIDGEEDDDLIGTYPTTLTPVETLDGFFGENGAGSWTLRVADVDDQDVGTLHSWAVHLWCQ
jgi:serine protease